MSASTRQQIPVVYRIDVEPDNASIDRDRRLPWVGFERGVEIMQSMRRRLAAATGSPARFAWLLRMDPLGEAYGVPYWA